MSYGVTAQGFIKKGYNAILEELQQKARTDEYFGAEVDLADTNFLGAMLKLMAWSVSQEWDLAEQDYYSFDIDTAEGMSLQRITKIGFVNIKGKQYAVVSLRFSGMAGKTVPEDTQAETAQNIIFSTLQEVVLNESGFADVDARCLESGDTGNVPADSITRIKTPVIGVDSVTNPAKAEGGRDIETDVELRTRYSELPAATGSSTPAIVAAVSEIDSVITAIGYENRKNGTDERGIPSKSFEIVVQGGITREIANVIFEKQPAGIDSYGNTEVFIEDSKGERHVVRFSRPETISLHIRYEITKTDKWNDDYIPTMKTNTIVYIGGSIDGKEYSGVGIGGTILSWKLTAAQNELPGIEKIEALISDDGQNWLQDKYVPLGRNIPQTETDNIEVVFI